MDHFVHLLSTLLNYFLGNEPISRMYLKYVEHFQLPNINI